MIVNVSLGYESPVAEILEVAAEGVFCNSYYEINDWEREEDDDELDLEV